MMKKRKIKYIILGIASLIFIIIILIALNPPIEGFWKSNDGIIIEFTNGNIISYDKQSFPTKSDVGTYKKTGYCQYEQYIRGNKLSTLKVGWFKTEVKETRSPLILKRIFKLSSAEKKKIESIKIENKADLGNSASASSPNL